MSLTPHITSNFALLLDKYPQSHCFDFMIIHRKMCVVLSVGLLRPGCCKCKWICMVACGLWIILKCRTYTRESWQNEKGTNCLAANYIIHTKLVVKRSVEKRKCTGQLLLYAGGFHFSKKKGPIKWYLNIYTNSLLFIHISGMQQLLESIQRRPQVVDWVVCLEIWEEEKVL